jgi:4-amino-4-deoxychorismate lyase
MSPLVESIKMNDGIIYNIEYHQDRLRRSLHELFPNVTAIDLVNELSRVQLPNSGLYKVRVVYGPDVEKIEAVSYAFPTIKSLKVVYHNDIDYHLKYTNRQLLNNLYSLRGSCNDIIIIKNGLVTDSFSANLLFFNGQHWLTAESPLLKGTKRQWLLDKGLIFESRINVSDLTSFQKVGLINAMIDFDEMPIIDIKNVYGSLV